MSGTPGTLTAAAHFTAERIMAANLCLAQKKREIERMTGFRKQNQIYPTRASSMQSREHFEHAQSKVIFFFMTDLLCTVDTFMASFDVDATHQL